MGPGQGRRGRHSVRQPARRLAGQHRRVVLLRAWKPRARTPRGARRSWRSSRRPPAPPSTSRNWRRGNRCGRPSASRSASGRSRRGTRPCGRSTATSPCRRSPRPHSSRRCRSMYPTPTSLRCGGSGPGRSSNAARASTATTCRKSASPATSPRTAGGSTTRPTPTASTWSETTPSRPWAARPTAFSGRWTIWACTRWRATGCPSGWRTSSRMARSH